MRLAIVKVNKIDELGATNFNKYISAIINLFPYKCTWELRSQISSECTCNNHDNNQKDIRSVDGINKLYNITKYAYSLKNKKQFSQVIWRL